MTQRPPDIIQWFTTDSKSVAVGEHQAVRSRWIIGCGHSCREELLSSAAVAGELPDDAWVLHDMRSKVREEVDERDRLDSSVVILTRVPRSSFERVEIAGPASSVTDLP